jgi:hypothetical protein
MNIIQIYIFMTWTQNWFIKGKIITYKNRSSFFKNRFNILNLFKFILKKLVEVFKGSQNLTLIRIAAGVYDCQNLEQV